MVTSLRGELAGVRLVAKVKTRTSQPDSKLASARKGMRISCVASWATAEGKGPDGLNLALVDTPIFLTLRVLSEALRL